MGTQQHNEPKPSTKQGQKAQQHREQQRRDDHMNSARAGEENSRSSVSTVADEEADEPSR